MSEHATKQVVFVCQHGALRSRLAAAFFNEAAPVGWRATSAGLTPQSQVSERVRPLLHGTDAEGFLDEEPPRSVDEVTGSLVIAIDCDLPGADSWPTTANDAAPKDDELRDAIRERVQGLVSQIESARD